MYEKEKSKRNQHQPHRYLISNAARRKKNISQVPLLLYLPHKITILLYLCVDIKMCGGGATQLTQHITLLLL